MSREGRGGSAAAIFAICIVMGLALVCVLAVSGVVAFRFLAVREMGARDMAVMNMEMIQEQAVAQQRALTLQSESDASDSMQVDDTFGIATIVIGNDSAIRIAGKELRPHGIGEAISEHFSSASRDRSLAEKVRIVVSPVASPETVGRVIQTCLRAGITIDKINDSGIVISPPVADSVTTDTSGAEDAVQEPSDVAHPVTDAHNTGDHAQESAASDSETATDAESASDALEDDAADPESSTADTEAAHETPEQ